MSAGRTRDEPRRLSDLNEWRVALLSVLLPASGVALVLVWFFFALSGGIAAGRAFWYLGAMGVVFLFLSFFSGAARQARQAPRALSLLFVILAFGLVAQGLRVGGWSPGVVVGLISLLVFAGLLLGRAAPYVVILAVLALFFAGALAVRASPPSADFPPTLEFTRMRNWVRVGSIFVCLTGAAGWGLGRIGDLLARAEAQLAGTVSMLRENLALLRATRARRTKTEATLRNAQKLQTIAQLGHGFAHVFNNVLTALRSGLEEAHAAATRAELARAAEVIGDVVEDAAKRNRDLLALARPHRDRAGEIELQRALSALAPRLRARLRDNVVLDVDAHARGTVGVSELWLEQLVTNLVLNAEQALPGGGQVAIRTGLVSLDVPRPGPYGTLPAGSYAVVRVSDDGPGMSDEVAERAFDPFFTTRGRERHDGLGLSVVYEMARKAGGVAQIERPPRGAAVAIYLPLARVSTTEGAPSDRAAHEVVRDGAQPGEHRVPSWKEDALRNLLRVSAFGTAVSVTVGEIHRRLLSAPNTMHLTVGIPLVIIFAILGWKRIGSYRVRLSLYVAATLSGCLLFVALAGFMTAAPVAGASLAILLAWVLDRPAVAKAGLACAWPVFLVAGYLHANGTLIGAVQQSSLARPENWIRAGLTLSCISFIGAAFVLHILRAARRRIEALAATEAELETARAQLHAEGDAVVDLESMAERASRLEAMGRFTGMIAHDLNNSLQVVGGWAEVLLHERAEPGSHDTLAALEEMQRVTDYAEALVSRLELGDAPPLTGTSIDLGQETTRAAGMLRALMRPGQTLTLTSAPDCRAAIDEGSFRRALLNLVANARDAMQAGGSCEVTIAPDGDAIEITITDDGCGMDEATRARLFEIFFTTKGALGTGLGLHSIAATIRAAGGTVEVWSRPQQGTRVTLRLPRARTGPVTERASGGASGRAAGPSTTPQPDKRAGHGAHGRILLAEDEPHVRLLLRRSLERAGFEVTEAADGDGATALIAEKPPFDAFCTDAVMPGRPTAAVIASFRARSPARPVVLMSGYLPGEIGDAVTALPEVTFLRKPFAGSSLAEAVAERLESELP